MNTNERPFRRTKGDSFLSAICAAQTIYLVLFANMEHELDKSLDRIAELEKQLAELQKPDAP